MSLLVTVVSVLLTDQYCRRSIQDSKQTDTRTIDPR
jgi:hypothetical protein